MEAPQVATRDNTCGARHRGPDSCVVLYTSTPATQAQRIPNDLPVCIHARCQQGGPDDANVEEDAVEYVHSCEHIRKYMHTTKFSYPRSHSTAVLGRYLLGVVERVAPWWNLMYLQTRVHNPDAKMGPE